MNGLNPDYLPPNRRAVAREAARQARADAIGRRAGVEARAALQALQEAFRTAGVVLAVLLVTDLYPASLWVISALFFAPALMNGAVLALAWAIGRRRIR